jgi:branched-chain amino acid transport system permease protein
MDASIAAILLVDGLTNGAIYALLAIAIVLVFSVTRIIFIPQGEYVAFSALTLGFLQLGQVPGTVWLLGALALCAAGADVLAGWRHGRPLGRVVARAALAAAVPLALAALTAWLAPQKPPLLVQLALTLAVVTAMGPPLYKLAYRSLADASVLVLLIVSVGVHFALTGLGLVFFGAEGFRTPALSDARLELGPVAFSGQTLVIVAAAVAGIAALFVYFERTLSGKALRATAVNPTGARLVGISAEGAGQLSFLLSAFIGALSGVLIGPTATLFYDSGFLIGLKGFVAAVFAGLASFPGALAGAALVGLVESFGSFWASAFKESIVFTAILPVLLWRSLADRHAEEH